MKTKKESGNGGGCGTGLFLILFVALAAYAVYWFAYPSVLALRDGLTARAAGVGAGVVNQVTLPIAPTAVYMDAAPPTTAPVIEYIIVTAAPPTAVPPSPVVAEAVQHQLPTAAPVGAAADTQFLQDCADGQAAGRRVSPRCPADAAAVLAGLQGQGR
jgi:hypothetical protein